MDPREVRELGFDADRLARVADAVRRDLEAGRCHGVSLVAARGGRVFLEILDGFADRDAGRKLGRDAVFASMSTGKQFTNVLALTLVERGALRLHQPVADVLPEFRALG